jgi:hypothetical protein
VKKPKVQIDTAAQAASIEAQTAAIREQTAAQSKQAETALAAEKARSIAAENAAALTRNMGTDLGSSNVAQVVTGGSADAAEGVQSTLRKRRPGGTLSSQLGVNT